MLKKSLLNKVSNIGSQHSKWCYKYNLNLNFFKFILKVDYLFTRLVNETWAIMLVQAGKSENCAGKKFLFLFSTSTGTCS